jgi:hypothetical protein
MEVGESSHASKHYGSPSAVCHKQVEDITSIESTLKAAYTGLIVPESLEATSDT